MLGRYPIAPAKLNFLACDVLVTYTRRRRSFLEFLTNSSGPGGELHEFPIDNPSASSFADAPPVDI
jgi:hypothetical protein